MLTENILVIIDALSGFLGIKTFLKSPTLVILCALIWAFINAYRGSGRAKKNKILQILFSKWVCVIYLFLLLWASTKSLLCALVFTPPMVFIYLTGTGGLHYTFLKEFPREFFLLIKYKYFDKLLKKIFPRINGIGEFLPFDYLTDKIVGEVKTINDLNKWGLIYGTLVGLVLATPFFIMHNPLGLLMPFLGLFCYGLKFIKPIKIFGEDDARWRLVEFSWFGFLYFLIAGLSVWN